MDETTHFPYIHGFSPEEQARLRSQAQAFEFIVYQDVDFYGIDHLLEVGSGVGAQSEIILRHYPRLKITGVDLNERQVEAAKQFFSNHPMGERVSYHVKNAENLDFSSDHFDGAFFCWVLEHVPSPVKILKEVRRVLKPGAPIVINEVMNSTFFLDPYSPNIWQYWMAFNNFQFEQAGDPFVGAKLGNLLCEAGFSDIVTKVKTLHYDTRHPEVRKSTIHEWRDLLLSAADELVENKCVTKKVVDLVRQEFDHVAEHPNSIIYYSFMQAQARA